MMKTKLTRSVSILALGHSLLACSYSMEKDEPSSTPAKTSSNLSQVMGALRSFMPFQTRGSLHSQAARQESERQPSTGTSSSFNRARHLSVIGIEPTVPLTDQQVTQFEENLHHLDRQLEILKITGIEPSEDNRAVRFLSEEDLYQRLVNNQHGRVLDLSGTSFETPKSIHLLEGIAATQSVYEVNLSSCRFTAPAFKTLCEALRLNESVRQVYLTDAVLPQGALEGLGEALKYNMTLDHLFLPLDHPFTAAEISTFYDHIRFNTALAFIGWPQKVLKDVEKQARTHPTALVHLGFLYSSPLMTMSESAKDHKTMEYFKKADKLKHPLGAYGLAKIYQKQENYPEALKFYERAADAEHAHSQMILSTYYRALWPQKSPLLSEPDYLQAFNWARQAAHLGFPEALYRVGRMYEAGRYVQHSLTKAGAYFHDAIQKGHPEAFTALGLLYNNPDYAYYDPEKAMTYLELAKRYTHLFSTATRLLKNIEDH